MLTKGLLAKFYKTLLVKGGGSAGDFGWIRGGSEGIPGDPQRFLRDLAKGPRLERCANAGNSKPSSPRRPTPHALESGRTWPFYNTKGKEKGDPAFEGAVLRWGKLLDFYAGAVVREGEI